MLFFPPRANCCCCRRRRRRLSLLKSLDTNLLLLLLSFPHSWFVVGVLLCIWTTTLLKWQAIAITLASASALAVTTCCARLRRLLKERSCHHCKFNLLLLLLLFTLRNNSFLGYNSDIAIKNVNKDKEIDCIAFCYTTHPPPPSTHIRFFSPHTYRRRHRRRKGPLKSTTRGEAHAAAAAAAVCAKWSLFSAPLKLTMRHVLVSTHAQQWAVVFLYIRVPSTLFRCCCCCCSLMKCWNGMTRKGHHATYS